MTTALHWQVEREQVRDALGARWDADLGTTAADIRRALDVVEADNARMRALLTATRYLSSEAVHGTLTAEGSLTGGPTVPDPAFEERASLADVLACPACRSHLGAEPMVVDACASVAHDTARSVAQVLAEYLWLAHRQQGHRAGEDPCNQ